jgi:hypothetical protein
MSCLTIGMVKTIAISIESIQKLGGETFLINEFKGIPFHLYERTERAKEVVWMLKPTVINRKLLPFLKAVYKLLEDSIQPMDCADALTTLAETPPAKRLAVADAYAFECFQSDNYGHEVHYQLSNLPHKPLCSIRFQTIMLALSDKMSVESDDGLFTLFQNLLRDRLAKFQLAKTLHVYMHM